MLSGIGDKNILDKYNIPLIYDNEEVEKNLQDHPAITVIKTVKEPKSTIDYMDFNPIYLMKSIQWILTNDNEFSNFLSEIGGFLHSETAKRLKEDAPDLQLLPVPGIFSGKDTYKGKEGFSLGIVLLNEKSRGNVTINSNKINDPPLIQPNIFENLEDLERLEDGLKFILKVDESKKLLNMIYYH